ncbi:hypothetical protein Q8309_001383 [Salmonella enterica]|nr:hypothetical protein [Salmonella enterica]
MTDILTITDITAINELAYKHAKRNDEIAAELGIPLEDVEAVLLRRYVADIKFKADDEITLADYNGIRAKFIPGKQSMSNEYCLAREFGIAPQTVNDIARGRFSNALTHPEKYAKPEPVEPVEAVTERLMDAEDVQTAIKLLRMSWSIADIAKRLDVSPARLSQLPHALRNKYPMADLLSMVNKGGAA